MMRQLLTMPESSVASEANKMLSGVHRLLFTMTVCSPDMITNFPAVAFCVYVVDGEPESS